MSRQPVITHEIARLPTRNKDAHKGDVGRIVVIGGCCDDEVLMAGAPALAANAALRSGAGLVKVIVPQALRSTVAALAPCATLRTLPPPSPSAGSQLLDTVADYRADVVVLGPGLGSSIEPAALRAFLLELTIPVLIDADGLNLLAAADPFAFPDPDRVVLTPHLGELRRLLSARRTDHEPIERTSQGRRDAALALVEAYRSILVLKGHDTMVTDGRRLYVNRTGNAGLATAGTGDVLSGVIAAFMGQRLAPFEAAILGVYLHGLAGDFAAEALGLRSLTALDVIEFLHKAICDYDATWTA